MGLMTVDVAQVDATIVEERKAYEAADNEVGRFLSSMTRSAELKG